MGLLTRIFSREKKQADILPLDLQVAIEAAWIVDRSTGGDDPPRLFFALSGRPLADLNKADVVFRKIYPELNEAQIQRAVQFLEDVARLRMREDALAQAGLYGFEPKNACRRAFKAKQR